MNYQKHYDLLIERTKFRNIVEYTEIHHIIPRCLGGSDREDNLAELTPEEHYVAHQLLVKIYPENSGLVYAAFMMGSSRINNKVYGWLRRRHAENISFLLSGKPKSVEHREKLSLAMKDKPSPKIGCRHTIETKQKISNALKGKIPNEDARLRMSISQKGKLRSVEDNTRRSIALKGRPKSEETKINMRIAQQKRRNKE